MRTLVKSGIPFLSFENLASCPELAHFVSTRAGGESIGGFGSLNLSFKVGDDSIIVERNRSKVAGAFGIESNQLVFPEQTHSAVVKLVTKDTSVYSLSCTDALITNEPGIMIAVMSADCVPILLFDPVKKVIAAIHAGWRGTMAQIVINTIEQMKASFGCDPSTILAGIGPSISDVVYEVGEEVLQAAIQVYGTTEGVIRTINGKNYCNLWEANKKQLIKTGLKEESIEVAGICTFSNSDTFYSYRKDGVASGRFAAGIMLF